MVNDESTAVGEELSVVGIEIVVRYTSGASRRLYISSARLTSLGVPPLCILLPTKHRQVD